MMKYRVRLRDKLYEVEFEIAESSENAEIPALFVPPPVPVPSPVTASPTPVSPPAPVPSSAGRETILAPLPGTLLSLKVQTGDRVKAGQILLILEAMKMENEVLSPKDGTVVQILVQNGTAVASGAPLLVLE